MYFGRYLYFSHRNSSILVKILIVFFTINVFVLLASCGGGGKDTTPPATTASPTGGAYNVSQSITLTCDDGTGSGCATTHYTLDGSDPTTGSTSYSAAIEITDNATLKFLSVDKDGNVEAIKTESYVIDKLAPHTAANPAGGSYAAMQSVTLVCDDSDGSGCTTTYYTIDGSDPTTASSAYSVALEVSANTTLKFFSMDNAGNSETIKTETYVVGGDTTAPTTSASPAAGTYNKAQSVTLSCDDVGGSGCATTYYTTNGDEPTKSSAQYSIPIDINTTTTIKFFSVDNAGNQEIVKSAAYTIDAIAPSVSATQDSGTYLTRVSVDLPCSDTGGSGCDDVYYTIDGTDPNKSSTLLTGAININFDTELRFIAYDKAGNSSAIGTRDYKITPVVSARYSNGANWNDYVKNDGNDPLSATNTACDNTGGDCIHGGELRAFEVPSSKCSGLDAQGTPNVFRWRCIEVGNQAYFVTAGFNRDKHLSDLIDWTAAPVWKQMDVTVTKSGKSFTTETATWWNNPITPSSGPMDQPGTIYYVDDTNNTGDREISADKVALLVEPGVTLTANIDIIGGGIVSFANNYIWIEGSLDTNGHGTGVNISGNYNVMRNISIFNSLGEGLIISDAKWNRITRAFLANNKTSGGLLRNVENSHFKNIIVSNSDQVGLGIQNMQGVGDGSDRNTFVDITLMNNQRGMGIPIDSKGNFLSNVTVANNIQNGIQFYGELSSQNTIQNIAAINNQNGLVIFGRPPAVGDMAYFLINNVVSAHNGTAIDGSGIQLFANHYSLFTGWLKVGNTFKDCETSGSVDIGLGASCENKVDSDADLRTGINAVDSVGGKVITDDGKNTSDATGSATYDISLDWTNFQNRFRAWGMDGSGAYNKDNRGRCTSGTCRIWDWSAASNLPGGDMGDPFGGGTPVLLDVNAYPTGNDILVHYWKVLDADECDRIADAVWNAGECITTFLKNAVERLGDFIGNDNGFCESNETCIYTRNIGSYQGHGSYGSAGDFVDGVITGVSLKQNANNGR